MLEHSKGRFVILYSEHILVEYTVEQNTITIMISHADGNFIHTALLLHTHRY